MISARTPVALAPRRRVEPSDARTGLYHPPSGPAAVAVARVRREGAERAARRLTLKVAALRDEGITSLAGLARALIERGVATPWGSAVWTRTTVARVIERAAPRDHQLLAC